LSSAFRTPRKVSTFTAPCVNMQTQHKHAPAQLAHIGTCGRSEPPRSSGGISGLAGAVQTTSWTSLRSEVSTPVRSFWRAVGVGVFWLAAGIGIRRMLGLVLVGGSIDARRAGVVCGERRAVGGALAGRVRCQAGLGWDWFCVAHSAQR
jgi:hypothetical protein